MNYEKDLEINPEALDVEWLNQPMLFMKYSALLAEARKELDFTTDRLEVVKAETDFAIRKSPEIYLGEGVKLTETSIKNGILKDRKVREVQDSMLEIKNNVDILTAAVRAFDHRKKALENLVMLHGQQYFAGPKTPRNLKSESDIFKEAKEERREQTNTRSREVANNRRRTRRTKDE